MFGKLELSFGAPAEAPAGVPDARSESVQTWRTLEGDVITIGHTVNGTHWMHWPGLASFAFDGRNGRVVAYPSANVESGLVSDIYQRGVLPIALQALGAEALHASAVLTPHGVVGFFATSETGKSTLAFELAKRGYAQWSDDSLVFDTDCSDPTAIPLPFRVRVRGGDLDTRPRTSFLPQRALVAALFLLERAPLTGREPVYIERLAGGQAFFALLTQVHCFDVHNPERRARTVRFFLNVAARVPILRLRFRPGLHELPVVVNTVEHAIRGLEPQ